MSGVFHQKPALPKYSETWDPQVVITYIQTFPDLSDMTFKQLTLKLTMLLALITAQRTQTLKALSIQDMQAIPDRYVFLITSLLKQTSSKSGRRHLGPVVLKECTLDNKLCIVRLLKEYLRRTCSLRKGEPQLLLCHTKPHGAASKDSISPWINTVMPKAGIDPSLFKLHSRRSAATSAAKAANVPMFEIMSTSGWLSSSVFGKYYDKPVIRESAFAHNVPTGTNKLF